MMDDIMNRMVFPWTWTKIPNLVILFFIYY